MRRWAEPSISTSSEPLSTYTFSSIFNYVISRFAPGVVSEEEQKERWRISSRGTSVTLIGSDGSTPRRFGKV